MKPTFAARGIEKSYGGVGVLHGVELNVAGGEIVGLVGANGAGKTTLIDIIGGQQSADSGEMMLGATVLAGGPTTRARLGLARTFQRPQIAGELTIRQNVIAGTAVRTLPNLRHIIVSLFSGMATGSPGLLDDVDATCDSLALAALDRRASEVTFGELRLIEVARALVQRPTLMMLDEPFSGVGDGGIAAIADALRTVRRQGCAVLVVDHNVDLLVELVDRLALLAEGRILVEGRVNDCLRNDVFRQTYIGVV